MAKPSFLLSDLFQVIAPGGTTFTVHQDLLAEGSEVLAKAVNGPMREGTTKVIKIEAVDDDIDDDTVMRFLEYMYTGKYSVPDPVVVQVSSESKKPADLLVEGVPASATDNSDGKGLRLAEYVPSLPNNSSSLEPRSPTIYDTPETLSESRPSEIHTSKTDKRSQTTESTKETYEDYTPIFMCHARLYKFADRYSCNQLVPWCVAWLSRSLNRSEHDAELSIDLVALIRYTWLHTMDDDEGFDAMRSCILQRLTWGIVKLCKEDWFRELLNELGSFSSDLVRMMALEKEKRRSYLCD